MLLAFKRYGLPLFITVCIYTLVYFVCKSETEYFNAGLVISLLYAFLMRFTDDIVDYDKDLKEGKTLLKRNVLIVSEAVTALAVVVLAAVFEVYLMLIPLIDIGLILLFKKRIGEFFKPLFTPTVIITLALSLFKVNYLLFIIVAVLTVFDGILVLKGRK